MRNFKKVSAIIMTVIMILTTVITGVFADTTSKTPGQICKGIGVLKGGSNGVDATYLSAHTQRIQAAIIYLRMLGLENDARGYSGSDNFSDVSLVNSIAGAKNILAYCKANPKLGWVGDGKKFSPSEEVSAQQFYKVMLTLLGYTQGTDFNYNETLTFAKFKGMSNIANLTKLTNADMATALVEALNATIKGGGPSDTLIAKMVRDGRISESAAIANGFKIITTTTKIASVAAPADKTVDFGTANPNLPSTVKATMSDGKVTDVGVVWDLSKYDANKAGVYIIVGKIAGFDAGVSVKVTVKALAFDVADINVKNLRQIEINFNSEVANAQAAEDVSNYAINGISPVDASLSSGNKSVTLTTIAQNAMVNFSNNNKLVIYKAAGLSADKTIDNITAKDADIPNLVSAEATSPNIVRVTFSEPLDERVSSLQTAQSFSVDSNMIAIDASNVTYDKVSNVIIVRLLANLSAGTNIIKVKSLAEGGYIRDSAGYYTAPGTASFNYSKDNSPLTATATDINEFSIDIKFNKALKAYSFAGNQAVVLSHTYQGQNKVTGVSVTTTDNQEFIVTFAVPLPPNTDIKVYLNYADGTVDSNKIQDNYGNIYAPTSFTVKVTQDTTKPNAIAEYVDSRHIKVTFTKAVNVIPSGQYSALNYTNYTLKDPSGTIIPWAAGVPAITTPNTVFTLTTNKDINGGILTMDIKNIKDVSFTENQINDATLTIIAPDKVAPTLDSTTPYARISSTKIEINFSEAMDISTISDKNNYRIGADATHTVPLSANDSISVVNNNKSVVITFSTPPIGTDHIFIGVVKDIAGNTSEWLAKDVGIIGVASSNILQSAAEVISGNKIKITINDQITSTGTYLDYMYKIGAGGTWSSVSAITSVNIDSSLNKTYIELAIGTDIGNDTGLSIPVYVATTDGSTVGNASPNIRNGLGQAVQITNTTICTDKYAPKYVTATVGATSGGRLTSVVLLFSENLYVASVQDSDFTVAGFEIDSLAVNNNLVIITLKVKDNSDTERPIVTMSGSVEDSQKNVLNGPVANKCL